MRRRAILGDANFAVFELLITFNFRPRHDALQSFAQGRGCDYRIGSPELGTHRAFADADGKVEIARNQRTDDTRAAAADDDNFDIDAVFSKQSLVLSYQILPLVALTELNPTRSLSCAASGVGNSNETIRLVV